MMPSLRNLVVRGSIWTVASYGGAQLLRLGSNLILTRVLVPEAFGLMALVNVFVVGLAMFSDIGIGPGIIHSRRDDAAFLDTAWTIQALRGALLWICSCAIAWPLARLYRQPELARLLPLVALTALISGFNSTSLFTLNRSLAIVKLTVFNLGNQLASILVMVAWAWLRRDLSALVGGAIVGSLLRMISSHWLVPCRRNRFCWDAGASRALFGFGRWIFVSTLLFFLASQIDRLLLGALIPMDRLGVYNLASTLANLPLSVGATLATTILYPALASQARDDRAGFALKLRRMRRTLLPVGLVATVVVAAAAPLFFRLYDTRYQSAGTLAQLMCVPAWFSLLHLSADNGLLAVGDTGGLALRSLFSLVGSALGSLLGHCLAGVPGFIVGSAAGPLASQVAVQIRLARHGIRLIDQDLVYTLAGAVSFLGAGLLAAS